MDDTDKISEDLQKNFLDLFWNLADENDYVRISTTSSILRFLHKKQKQVKKIDDLTINLKYCIERLVKGLSSPRDAARMGFALLLTSILKQFTTVEVEEVLDLIKQHLSFIPKQEKRDIVFGQLFAYSSIVRSGRLVSHSHLSFVTLAIYDLWQSRTYVLNACYDVLQDLFSQLSPEQFKENLWPHLKNKFSSGWEECLPENLWLLLMSARMFPEVINESYFKKHWNTSNILSAENFDNLKKFVRQTTSSVPNLHPLSSEIAIICSSGKKRKELWNNVVDENLFEGDHMEKSFIGFEMIKCALQSAVNKKLIKYLLGPKFSALFARNYLNLKSHLNPAASQLAHYLSTFGIESNDPDIQLLVLKFFLQLPNNASLDLVLKQKEVSHLIQNLSSKAIKLYFVFLKNAVTSQNNNSDDGTDIMTNYKKYFFISQIGGLVFHPNVVTDIEWRIHVIKFLLLNSFFLLTKTTSEILHCEGEIAEMDEKIRTSFANAFFKSLTFLYQRIEPVALQQSVQLLLLLVEYSDQLMAADENISPLFSIEKVVESWQQIKNIVHRLRKHIKKDLNVNESHIFLALFLELGFYLFYDFEYVADILEELHICCDKVLHNFKNCNEQQVDITEPSWICVVIDIILSLLSRESQHLRRLVASVFELLCPFINQDALQPIFSIINPDTGKDELMVVEEPDDESELKFESGSSSQESEYDYSEMSVVDENFKQNVKDALGSAADHSDDESIVLSDSDMFKLDGALSKAFHEQKQTGPNQMKSEDKSVLHFRVRAYDLVLIYLKSDPPMCLALQCINAVLETFEHGNEQQKVLLNKSMKVLELITRIKTFKDLENVKKSDLNKLLEMVVPKCHKESNLEIAKKLYAFSVFIVLCYRRLESCSSSKKTTKKCPFYLKVYFTALEVFATGNSSNMFPQFFVEFMKSCPDLAWELIEPCKNYAFNYTVRIYRRTQCLGLLLEAMKFAKGQISVKNDQWTELENVLIPKAVETLKVIIEEFESKPTYLRKLLEVIYTIHFIVKEKTDQSVLEQYIELVQLLSNLPKQHAKKLAKRGRSLKYKIIHNLGGYIGDKKMLSDKTVSIEETKTEHSDVESTLIDSLYTKRKSNCLGKSKKVKTMRL